MYNVMKKFIETKYYATKEEAQSILDVFLISMKVTPSEYAELTLLIESVYNPIITIPEDDAIILPEQEPVPIRKTRSKKSE